MALHAFERRLTDDTKLVVCNHVSNVFGYIQPVERIAEACRARGVPFVVDASQSAGVCEIDFERIGADFICMPGHKGLYGPQGTGLLLCARIPKSLLQGGTGSQSALVEMPDTLPDRAEAGTHNMPGIAGLRAGIEFVERKKVQKIMAHEHSLVEYRADEAQTSSSARIRLLPTCCPVRDGMDCKSWAELPGAAPCARITSPWPTRRRDIQTGTCASACPPSALGISASSALTPLKNQAASTCLTVMTGF